MLEFDTDRPPLREQDFVALVRAVVAARPGDESSWLEWKGHLELAKPDAKGAVARCIVAFANRDPQAAARFCDGRAYLVVGAEPGRIVGIAEADPADLTGWWEPYLGVDGPRWEPHWVTVEGATVLVVEVDTPRRGDPLHVIRKETLGVRDGDIYLRRAGKSERATSADIRALSLRAGGARSLTGVSVRLSEPEQLTPVAFDLEAIEVYLDAVRDACLASLRTVQPPRTPKAFNPVDLTSTSEGKKSGVSLGELEDLEEREAAGASLDDTDRARLEQGRAEAKAAMSGLRELVSSNSFGWSVKPETRTAEQYIAEVERYLDTLRQELPDELAAAASHKLLLRSFVLTNDTEQNLEGVRLVVHIPGKAAAIEPDEPRPGLSAPPRRFGPVRENPLHFGTSLTSAAYLSRLQHSSPRLRSGVDIEDGGSVRLRFDPKHLRPHDTVELDPVVLLLPDNGPVTATWEATSTSLNGVLRGELVIPVAGSALSIQEALLDEPESG